ncbi:MAG: hypothetical protein Q7J73_05510 [Dehalococcoidales bacterium]|nr:hypothetical protein [Dehalococcoidales bacterium]
MSPIKGISEIVRLPRLGKIRLGIKKKNDAGVSYPSPTDYFVCPDEVKKVFGDKPKELRIMFPTEDLRQWASQYLRCYSVSRRLICRGDGEMALARVDIHTSEIAGEESEETGLKETTCNPARCSYHQRGDCRKVMNLQFLLPDCPGFGVYQLNTSSFYSIVNVNSSLELIRGICGRLSMIPLSLKLVEQEILTEGKRKTVRVLRLTAPYSFAEIQRYAQTPPGRVLLPPAPDSEAPDDLSPEEEIGAKETRKVIPDKADRQLIDLWARAKSKIWHFGIPDYQIANWFQKNCHLTVRLKDFDPPVPPDKFTREQLACFIREIERHTQNF